MLCPFCKGEIPDDAKKCMHCGEWIDPAYRKPKRDDQQGCLAAVFELCSSVVWFALILFLLIVGIWLFLDQCTNIEMPW